MKIAYLYLLVLLQVFNQAITAQTTHDITVTNFSFSPGEIIINVGDVVRWTNTAGLHNVVADDNSFTSGAVSSSAWVYEHTFNSVGTNPYYCAQHGGPGGVGMAGVVTVQNATDVADDNISIYEFELDQNYPNPFNPSTKISWQSPLASHQSLKVFDVLGNEIATLVDEYKPAGMYNVQFSMNNLPSGLYLYKLQAGSYTQTRKMILLK